MSELKEVYFLVANELKKHLEDNPKAGQAYIHIQDLDRFLVDGRRQLRLWQKKKQDLASAKRLKQSKHDLKLQELQTAEQAKNEKLIHKLNKQCSDITLKLQELELEMDSIDQFSESIKIGLEKLENKVQKLRQDQSQTENQQQELKDLIVDFDKINIS